jgi:hypothetical protein
MFSNIDTRELERVVERARTSYDATLAEYRSHVAGEAQTRRDGTTYNPGDPLYVAEWKLDDLAKADGANQLAAGIQAQVENGADLIEVTRRVITKQRERMLSGLGGSDPIRRALDMARREGVDSFVQSLEENLSYYDSKRQARAEKLAAKFDELYEEYADSDAIVSDATVVLASVLGDTKTWLAWSEPELDSALSALSSNLSTQKIADAVDAEDDAELAKRQAEAAKATAEREARQAVQCRAKVYNGYRHERCATTGRYVLTLEDGSQVRLCGTHIKHYGQRYEVGSTYYGYDGAKTQRITAITDTKA